METVNEKQVIQNDKYMGVECDEEYSLIDREEIVCQGNERKRDEYRVTRTKDKTKKNLLYRKWGIKAELH